MPLNLAYEPPAPTSSGASRSCSWAFHQAPNHPPPSTPAAGGDADAAVEVLVGALVDAQNALADVSDHLRRRREALRKLEGDERALLQRVHELKAGIARLEGRPRRDEAGPLP